MLYKPKIHNKKTVGDKNESHKLLLFFMTLECCCAPSMANFFRMTCMNWLLWWMRTSEKRWVVKNFLLLGWVFFGEAASHTRLIQNLYSHAKKKKFRQIGSKWDFQAILKGFVERNKHRFSVVRHNLIEEFFVIMFYFLILWFLVQLQKICSNMNFRLSMVIFRWSIGGCQIKYEGGLLQFI